MTVAPDRAAEYLDVIDQVPGWFFPPDTLLFVAIDDLQSQRGITGDILEIGVYRGRCSILLGCLVRSGERLVVCDLFEDSTGISSENEEERQYYSALHDLDLPARRDFERCYLRFHPDLPVIHQMPSAGLDSVLPAGSFCMIHIDGGHTYEVVQRDIETARQLLGKGGVVIFDDWSNAQEAGVALAIWQEYLKGELVPLCFTPQKLYATWDPAGITSEDINAWAVTQPDIASTYPHKLLGHEACHLSMIPEFWHKYNS